MSAENTQNTSKPKPSRPARKNTGTRSGNNRPATDKNPTKQVAQKAAPTGGKPKTAAAEQRSALPTIALLISLITLGGAAAGGYWIWLQLQQSQQTVQQANAQATENQQALGRIDGRLEQRLAPLATADKQLQQQISQQNSDIGAKQRRLEEAVSAMRRELGYKRQDWALAETAYLLQTANQRLRLQNDPKTATSALKLADELLKDSGDPAFYPVREQIAAELNLLRGVTTADITGMSMSLAAMIEQIDTIPLNAPLMPESLPEEPKAEQSKEIDPSDWQAMLDTVYQEAKSMFVIRTHNKPITSLVSPAQHFLILENMRLRLESARTALMSGNETLYQDSLKRADEWLRLHFDTQDPLSRGLLARMDELADIRIVQDMPDISASLRILNTVVEQRRNQQQAEPQQEGNGQ